MPTGGWGDKQSTRCPLDAQSGLWGPSPGPVPLPFHQTSRTTTMGPGRGPAQAGVSATGLGGRNQAGAPEAGPPPVPTQDSPESCEMVKAAQAHRIVSLSFLIPIDTHQASGKASSSLSPPCAPQCTRPGSLCQPALPPPQASSPYCSESN